ncbi:hypothetical protein [Methylobacterium bullatum]|uniref:hypothetical protein n=1 Tax=Methylobacterium bullatum TaxID=570505 RepID=UPI001784C8CB|nr:hypothetical protein [Methylobacterium bullatum]MBD8903157.1 hypothetical protein [Methylobacterium bullatum]
MGEFSCYDDVDALRGWDAGRVLASIRSACGPSTLLPGLLILVGWLAFLGWTGAGSDGWQARVCADHAEQSWSWQARSCGMTQAEGSSLGADGRSAS